MADRKSGRSRRGYNCNLTLVGRDRGDGASWVDPTYGHCAYIDRSVLGNVLSTDPGVKVVNVERTARPRVSATLSSPAMLADTWESLKVSQKRGLLAGVSASTAGGAVFFDIYDVKHHCAHPRLLNSVAGTKLSLPANVIGHEGGWSPDGRTYWSSGAAGGSLTAIDVSNPQHPRTLWTGSTTVLDHGFDISPDGNRMYLSTTVPAGFVTLDISQIQARKPLPVVKTITQAAFPHSTAPQHTIWVSEHGKAWVIGVDEIGQAGIHFVDIGDPRHPIVHPGITLQIQQPRHAATAARESRPDDEGIFGYSPHYCSVDRIVDPRALACGYFQAGIRVFDIRDLARPREIAYFNPPGHTPHSTGLNGSYHSDSQGDLATDWCTSPPAFVGRQLWVTCQDSGFMTLRFGPHVLPWTLRHGHDRPSDAAAAGPRRALLVGFSVTRTPTRGRSRSAAVAVALIIGIALMMLGWRRRRPRATTRAIAVVSVALALPLAVPATRTEHASRVSVADIAFAQNMIAHHRQAVDMARAVEVDSRSTPLDREFARQIDVQQTREIALMSSWLVRWHRTEVLRPPPVMAGDPRMTCGLHEASYNRQFLVAMLAHHAAAVPIIKTVIGAGTPAVETVAQTMLIDQTTEMRWMQTRLRQPGAPLR